jgi:hypothetical protein
LETYSQRSGNPGLEFQIENIFTSPILLITLAALPLDWTQRWAGLWITVGLIKAII